MLTTRIDHHNLMGAATVNNLTVTDDTLALPFDQVTRTISDTVPAGSSRGIV